MAHIDYRVGGKNPDEAEQPRLRTDARYAKVPAVDVDGPLNHHPGECGRWVYRPKDAHPHPGTMEGCREPVRSMGFRPAFGKRRVRFYSCDEHVEGLETLRPVNRERPCGSSA